MTTFALRIRAATPLALRRGRDTEHAETLPYLPGTVLLGAFATVHTWLRGKETEEFATFFRRNQIRFGNAYPARFSNEELQHDLAPVLPIPTSARSCKRASGFHCDSAPAQERHGVSDHLIPWTMFALSGEQEYTILDNVSRCAMCKEPMDRISGFYRRSAEGKIGRADVKTQLMTRTGISRTRGTVQESILYSREAIRAGSEFWGWVEVPEHLQEAFKAFYEEVRQVGLLRIGTSRSRGLGGILLSDLEPLTQESSFPDLRERVSSFSTALKEQARQVHVPLNGLQYFVSLTLTADAIFLDRLLRYHTNLDEVIRDEAGVTGAKLVYTNASSHILHGWNELIGLPRVSIPVVGMGAVFLFGFEQEPNYAALDRLEREGIGERRSEGFGTLRVADRFHWEVVNA